MTPFLKLALLPLLFIGTPAFAAINILACEPEWGALAQEIGGEQVTISNATNALQDPHHIQAKPSLLARARSADMLVCTGAELEIGWLPILLQQSGNAKIQPGKPGYFEAAQQVKMLEIPARLDRADGDVHAAGNPHIQTDPRNIGLVAAALAKRLAVIDPEHASVYLARQADFSTRWQAAITRWEKQAAPLRGQAIVVQHNGFPYLENWLGLKRVATLEPTPGVEPNSGHLATVLSDLQRQSASLILRAAYNSGRSSEWLASRTVIPAVVLPYTVGGSDKATNLFGLFDDTIARLMAAVK